MEEIANWLSRNEYVLRSGGADGADLAFERGAHDKCEIYLPWKGFGGSNSNLIVQSSVMFRTAMIMAERIWNYRFNNKNVAIQWNILKTSTKLLMCRNVYQVLGADLSTRSEFVLCWTPGGEITGGTAQAIVLAKFTKIPVLNLFDPDLRLKMISMIHENLSPHNIPWSNYDNTKNELAQHDQESGRNPDNDQRIREVKW
jgi:hypothetical protein